MIAVPLCVAIQTTPTAAIHNAKRNLALVVKTQNVHLMVATVVMVNALPLLAGAQVTMTAMMVLQMNI